MLQNAIALLLIVIIVPLCSILAVRCIAKTKRQRRPVHSFRLR